MRERPILFNADMVRAILDGRKTQTRRVIKPQPTLYLSGRRSPVWRNCKNTGWFSYANESRHSTIEHHCPYGVPGDRLWVRETWAAVWPDLDEVPLEQCTIEYRADLPVGCTDWPGRWPAEDARGNPDAPKWRPSIFMFRWASRIDLEVTGVRVEQATEPDDTGTYDTGDWVWVVEFKAIQGAADHA